MQTEIIPEIIEEPIKAGCAPGNETLGFLAGEISRLRARVRQLERGLELLREGVATSPNTNIVDYIDTLILPNTELTHPEPKP